MRIPTLRPRSTASSGRPELHHAHAVVNAAISIHHPWWSMFSCSAIAKFQRAQEFAKLLECTTKNLDLAK